MQTPGAKSRLAPSLQGCDGRTYGGSYGTAGRCATLFNTKVLKGKGRAQSHETQSPPAEPR